MTFTTYELWALLGKRGVVQESPLSAWQRIWVTRQWPAWSGEILPREQAAVAFGFPETYGPPRMRSFRTSLIM